MKTYYFVLPPLQLSAPSFLFSVSHSVIGLCVHLPRVK